nr:hypothetical protein [Vibrio cholerae]
MSIITRQILWGVCASLLLLVFFSISYLIVFPPATWSALWEKEVMDVPFILFLISVDITLGVLIGYLSGFSWKKQ